VTNWVKKLKACREKDVGRSKMAEWIALGFVRAKKEEGSKNAAVWVDLDSVDQHLESLPDAGPALVEAQAQSRTRAASRPKGSIDPKKHARHAAAEASDHKVSDKKREPMQHP
jgi:hypothetical protein